MEFVPLANSHTSAANSKTGRDAHATDQSMKITKITQQAKRRDRYSLFVDGEYSFSLSESALLESRLASGQVVTADEIVGYKKLSVDDKLYNQALRYVALRMRSTWDLQMYLERKGAAPALADSLLNKLSNIGLLDDMQYANSFVSDRRLLRPTSRRKLIMELRKKHIASDIIELVVGSEPDDEKSAINEVIIRKRRQSKYQDDTKLMQYLARQGFSYGDIKRALQQDEDY